MKFGENLAANVTPEWRKQYINYEEMKAMMYAALEEAPSAEVVDLEEVTRYFKTFDEKFFQYCENELTKINTFYSEKLAESTRRMNSLQNKLKETLEPLDMKRPVGFDNPRQMLTKKEIPSGKLRELKLAFSEFYLSLILLQKYQNLNSTGFHKIMKKHDKLLHTVSGSFWVEEKVNTAHFHVNKDTNRLLRETEETVTWKLEEGDRQKAMKRLRVPPLAERHSNWTIFKVGLFSGSLIILFIAAVLSAIFHHGRDDWHVALRIYRGPLVLVEFIFLLGVNVHAWKSVGINHVLIFELDPRNHLSEQHLLEFASVFGVAWALSVLGFLYSSALGIPPYAFPIGLMIVVTLFLLNPIKIFRYEARFWLLRIMGRMLGAPMFFVNFPDFWLADQVNSLWFALLDFHYFACFYATNDNWMVAGDTSQCMEKAYISRSVVAAFPAWLRFAQCCRRFRDTKDTFPHLLNAMKYSTVFFVFGFLALHKAYEEQYSTHLESPFFHFWVMSSIISSLATYAWDVKLDWGLFDKNAGENKFLREELFYSSTSYYYFAIIEDLIMRFNWAIIYGFVESGIASTDLMVSIISPLEVFRRFIWNLFRLENEHLNNCGQFRAVRDISVAPIDSSDQTFIIKMMDEEDGVVECRKRKNFKRKEEKLPTDHKKHEKGNLAINTANMKFGEYLLKETTLEWSEQYINYEGMKKILYTSLKEQSCDTNEFQTRRYFYDEIQDKFFSYCEKELMKVNYFYSEKLAESKRRLTELKFEMKSMIEEKIGTNITDQSNIEDSHEEKEISIKYFFAKSVPLESISKLRLSLYDLYLNLIFLQNYQNLNFLGFQRILRKYNKLLFIDYGTRWYQDRVLSSHFCTSKETKLLINEIENIVSEVFEEGDLQTALKKLRCHPEQDRYSHGNFFKVGLYSGFLFLLLIAALLSAFSYQGGEDWHVVLRIYRGPLVMVELVFFAGINIHIWQKYGINHIRIFDLDPKDHLNKYDVLEIACLLGIVWTTSVLGFLYSSYLNIPPYYFPLAMIIVVMIVLLNPFPIFWYKSRIGLLRITARTFMSPTFPVYFADYWLADQMISLWLAFMDIHFFFCFYITRGSWTTAGDTSQCLEQAWISRCVAASIPAAIRFAQCLRLYWDTKLLFPHVANAGKYGTVICVFTFLGVFRVKEHEYPSNLENPHFMLWVFFSILNAVWAYLWDVMIDWGLFSKFTGKNKFLKEELFFPNKVYYYMAIISDFILRYNWLLLYLMTQNGYASLDVMFLILSPLEAFRRFFWSIFRLENEHIKNREKYQSLRTISIVNSDNPEEKLIIKDLDNEHFPCRKRKSIKHEDENDCSKNKDASLSMKKGIKQILPFKLMKGSYKPGDREKNKQKTNDVFMVSSWREYN